MEHLTLLLGSVVESPNPGLSSSYAVSELHVKQSNHRGQYE